MKNRAWKVRRGGGYRGLLLLAVAICLCLTFVSVYRAQQTTKQGNIIIGDTNGKLFPTAPFSCYVDGVAGGANMNIAACISLLGTRQGGVITSNTPEDIATLPWDPGSFSGVLQLGDGNASGSCSAGPPPTCWFTEVPIILGSGMRITGSGRVAASGIINPNAFNGTAIVAGSNFPAPLGQPSTTATCAGTGGSLTGTFRVVVVWVNNLDGSAGGMKVPGFSAPSMEAVTSPPCSNATSITVTAPSAAGTIPFQAQDYRVFATTANGLSGSETLQAPNLGLGMTCTGGSVDTAYGCALSASASITAVQTNGDFPNLVDLSNPLVVEIGPLIANGTTSAQNEGFGSVVENLTLMLPASAGSHNPNVAFWNPSNQENSGLSFVNFTGTTSANPPTETGAWIYIGNHAPNSFVENVQTDGNPNSGAEAFDAIILDGRSGFGSATGTARMVSNSTFTPGRGGGTGTIIGALVTGTNADTDFVDDHFEVSGSADCIQVITGASVSAQGNAHFCNPFIHLYSAASSPSGTAGNDIAVRNVTTSATKTVVKDDVNGVTLTAHVSDYSTAKNTPSLILDPAGSAAPTTAGQLQYNSTALAYRAGSNTATWTLPKLLSVVPLTADTINVAPGIGETAFANTLTIPPNELVAGKNLIIKAYFQVTGGSPASTVELIGELDGVGGTPFCSMPMKTALPTSATRDWIAECNIGVASVSLGTATLNVAGTFLLPTALVANSTTAAMISVGSSHTIGFTAQSNAGTGTNTAQQLSLTVLEAN